MPKHELTERFLIEEAMQQDYDWVHNDLKIVMPEDVSRVGEIARNKPEDFVVSQRRMLGAGALVIAYYSLGIRDLYPRVEPIYAEPKGFVWNDSWTDDYDAVEAYPLKQLERVKLGSGTSGAAISFVAQPNNTWLARFERGDRPSTLYRRTMLALGGNALHDDSFKKNAFELSEQAFEGYLRDFGERD